jgi:hypothetical protein
MPTGHATFAKIGLMAQVSLQLKDILNLVRIFNYEDNSWATECGPKILVISARNDDKNTLV